MSNRNSASRRFFERLSLEVLVNGFAASPLVWVRLRGALLRGNRIRVDRTARVAQRVRFTGRAVTIGPNCHLNDGVLVDDEVTIGARANIGPRAMLLTRTHDIGDHNCRRVNNVTRPVKVGDGCWIGAGAIVLPGISVGAGCVIAAGSVVSRDCAPDGLYAGIPARRLKDLP